MRTLSSRRVYALLLTAAIIVVIGCARGVPGLEEPPPPNPVPTLTPGPVVVRKLPNATTSVRIAPWANLATATISENPSQESTPTWGARTPRPNTTSIATRPTHTPSPRPTESHRQPDAQTTDFALASKATPEVPSLNPTVTPLAEVDRGSRDSNVVSEPLPFQEFFDEACKLNDRTKWYGDGPKGE